ncbi:HlyC/CorC family transporter [Candidatus Sumerlaeota bacterium]|nr:HlyC/CorC family transporter [Candidatus Sumerlaeota bacterium]
MLTLIIIIVSATLITSFLCSLFEAALYSIPPSRVEALRSRGHPAGRRLAALRADIDRPIAAILILNTIANSAGAVLAGALVGQHFGSQFLGIFTAALTFAILFLSEIIPKTLGAAYAPAIAPRIAMPLSVLVTVLSPLVWLCRGVTRILRRGHGPHVASEEDILAMAMHGAKHGELLPEEARWVGNAMRLNDRTARDLMTPRTVVYSLPADLPLAMIEAHSAHWTHSRLPLVRDDQPDQVEGIVFRRDVFDRLASDQTEGTLRDLMGPALFVPETMPANLLLQTFIRARQHLAVVVDEFGGMEGVVTLEDVLEELLGEEIVDEHDVHVDMQEHARREARRRRGRQPPTGG